MSTLSDFMRAWRDDILRDWTQRMQAELSTARGARTVPLEDSARVLDTIIDSLASETAAPSGQDAPRAASVVRLPKGCELSEVVLEYALLRHAILDCWLREIGATMPVTDFLGLNAALDSSIGQSVVRFAQNRERLLVAVDRISMAALGRQELDAFLSEVTRTTEQTSCTVGSVVVFLRDGQALCVHSSLGVEVAEGTRVAIGEGFAGSVAAAQVPVSLPWDPQQSKKHALDTPIAPGTRALYGVPLLESGRLLGVIQLGSFTEAEFSEEDQLLFVSIGVRATTMIVQIQLSAERDRALAEAKRLLEITAREKEARQDLLAIVSHDLRNPLSTVSLNAGQIRRWAERTQNAQPVLKRAGAILDSSGQMARLVDDLLDLSRIEAGRLLPLQRADRNASELAADAVELFQPLASSRGLILLGECQSGPSVVSCDGIRIQQVFSNLIGNALQFTPRNGSITLRTVRSGAEVVFSVIDTGVGIEAAQLESIFTPYWQGRGSSRKGVGLGLSICKAIVEAHGGRIWAETRLGHGSAFSFALPAVDGAELSEVHGETT